MKFQAEELLRRVSEALDRGSLRDAFLTLRAACGERSVANAEPLIRRLNGEVLQSMACLSQLSQLAGSEGDVKTEDRQRLVAGALGIAEDLARALAAWGTESGSDSVPQPPILAQPMAGNTPGNPVRNPDCFLSYARSSRRHVEVLAEWLEACGFSVWFDKYIEGGARFPSVINERIDAARTVIVIWCGAAIKSDWVVYEAARAYEAGKLIPLRMLYLPLEDIPAPYPATLNILEFGDEQALLKCLVNRLH